jgi:hypothetical protein
MFIIISKQIGRIWIQKVKIGVDSPTTDPNKNIQQKAKNKNKKLIGFNICNGKEK